MKHALCDLECYHYSILWSALVFVPVSGLNRLIIRVLPTSLIHGCPAGWCATNRVEYPQSTMQFVPWSSGRSTRSRLACQYVHFANNHCINCFSKHGLAEVIPQATLFRDDSWHRNGVQIFLCKNVLPEPRAVWER